MTDDTRAQQDLEQLRRDVRYLKDRAEILDCIARHARGCDRHDADLITSAYFPDATDEHGHSRNSGADYAAWANSVHAVTSRVHTHNITTHNCEIDGDVAHADSYSIVVLLGSDGRTAQFISGRYIDRLERRDGQWRIALRRSTVEVMFTADAAVLTSGFFTRQGYIHGTRDKTDLSYERPLRLDAPAPPGRSQVKRKLSTVGHLLQRVLLVPGDPGGGDRGLAGRGRPVRPSRSARRDAVPNPFGPLSATCWIAPLVMYHLERSALRRDARRCQAEPH